MASGGATPATGVIRGTTPRRPMASEPRPPLGQRQRAEIVASQNTAANGLIAGVYEILIERQFVNNALQADGPAPPATLTEIARYRNAARSKIEPAFADLDKYDFPKKAAA